MIPLVEYAKMLEHLNSGQNVMLPATICESRDNLKSFSMSITVRAIPKLNLKFKTFKKIAVVARFLQNTQNMIISLCRFAENGRGEQFQSAARCVGSRNFSFPFKKPVEFTIKR